MPKRPEPHVIDERGRRVLNSALPAEWTVTPYLDDYGKDYTVEVFESGNATGELFHVQLKSVAKARPRQRDLYWSVRSGQGLGPRPG